MKAVFSCFLSMQTEGDIVMETEIGHRGGQCKLGGEDVDWYRGKRGTMNVRDHNLHCTLYSAVCSASQ